MKIRLKAVIFAIFIWCIVMPIIWIVSISNSLGIEPDELLVGFRPQFSMIALCLVGLVFLFLKKNWLGYYLVVCAAVPVVLLFAFGSISKHGVITNSVMLAAAACVVLFGERQNAL